MDTRKVAYRLVVLGLIISGAALLQAKNPDFPEEVLSAKTVAIRINFVGGTVYEKKTIYGKRLLWGNVPTHPPSQDELQLPMEYVRVEIEKAFNQKGRFRIVADPSHADIVCMVILYDPWLFQGKLKGSHSEAVAILKGGSSPHWDAAPVWMETDFGEYVKSNLLMEIGNFHDHVQRAERKMH